MRAIRIDQNDNVAVVVQDTEKGDTLNVEGVNIHSMNEIPIGHKMAIKEIKKDEMIIKYGVPIGRASTNINIGEHVHTHNVEDITENLCNENKEIFIRKGEE